MQSDKAHVSRAEVHVPADEFVSQASERVEQMLKAGVSRYEILTRLAAAGEVLVGPWSSVSILVLGEDGLLRNGASPSLPADYLRAIDCLKPDARVGTCAAAAATGAAVFTPDFLFGAGSMPIKAPQGGKVLGTFGTYFRQQRIPTLGEQKAVEPLASATALVLLRHQPRQA